MENKDKKIEVINVAVNPERKRKTQQEKQVLDTLTEEMNKREKMAEEMRRRKTAQIKRKNRKKRKIRIGMAAIASTLALSMAGCYKMTKPKESKENSVTEQEEIKITTKKEKLEVERQNLLAFLKDLYIEQLEEVLGNTIITTEDIALKPASYENYAFVNTRNRRNYYTWR